MSRNMRVCENCDICESYTVGGFLNKFKGTPNYSLFIKKFCEQLNVTKKELLTMTDLFCTCNKNDIWNQDIMLEVPAGCEYKLEHEILKKEI